MRVIPVIDLKDAQVVRGVAGRRDQYRPVEGPLAGDAQPATVAAAFAQALAFDEVYVADLDAIAGAEPDWNAYREIAEHLPRLWVDAGIGDATRARQLVDLSPDRPRIESVIVGLESVDGPDALAEIFEVLGPSRAVFSLDLKEGRPLTESPAWREDSAEQIVATAIEIGFRRTIVLDLARVGVDEGLGVTALCRKLHESYPQVELISGGGVRGKDDLAELTAAGCDAALVASALHDGRLGEAEVKAAARKSKRTSI